MVDGSIIVPLSGAIMGAIIGSYGTYRAQERSRSNRETRKTEQLRQSLLAELGSMDELATTDPDKLSTKLPVDGTIPHGVYKSNTSIVSLLDDEESHAVIRFYTGAIKLIEEINTTRDVILDSEHPQAHNMTVLNEKIGTLRHDWKMCVLELLANSAGYPSKIQTDDATIEVNEEIDPGELWVVLNFERLTDEQDEDEVQSFY